MPLRIRASHNQWSDNSALRQAQIGRYSPFSNRSDFVTRGDQPCPISITTVRNIRAASEVLIPLLKSHVLNVLKEQLLVSVTHNTSANALSLLQLTTCFDAKRNNIHYHVSSMLLGNKTWC
jgi:hypothetical protein